MTFCKNMIWIALLALLLGTGAAQAGPTKGKNNATSNKLLVSYDAIRVAFAADNLKLAKQASKRVAKYAKSMLKGKLGKHLTAAAKQIQQSKSIAAARLAFGRLSKHIVTYLKAHPKQAQGIQVYLCPMAKGYKKWIQVKGTMANPYMGKRMLMCGGKAKL